MALIPVFDDKKLTGIIEQSLKGFVGERFDEKMKELSKEKDAWVAGCVLNLMRSVDIQSSNDRIIITLRKDPTEK